MYEIIRCSTDIEPIKKHGIDFMGDLGLEINPDYFITQWSKFMSSGIGVVFYLANDGVVVGGIGAIKAPDYCSGKLTLIEMFWYVNPKHRRYGTLLYNAMENYFYNEANLHKFVMIHMESSMPEKLKEFYVKKGFKLLETQWIKEKI